NCRAGREPLSDPADESRGVLAGCGAPVDLAGENATQRRTRVKTRREAAARRRVARRRDRAPRDGRRGSGGAARPLVRLDPRRPLFGGGTAAFVPLADKIGDLRRKPQFAVFVGGGVLTCPSWMTIMDTIGGPSGCAGTSARRSSDSRKSCGEPPTSRNSSATVS